MKWVKKFIINKKIKEQETLVVKILRSYSNYYCQKNFGLKFKGILIFSEEENLIGKFTSYYDIPVYIAIGRQFYYKSQVYELFDVLEHELIHYSLCKLGLPYHDDDEYFQRVCEILEVPTEYQRGEYYEN